MSQGEIVVLARDLEVNGAPVRAYFACADGTAPKRVASAAEVPNASALQFIITPTKTYSEGMGGSGGKALI